MNCICGHEVAIRQEAEEEIAALREALVRATTGIVADTDTRMCRVCGGREMGGEIRHRRYVRWTGSGPEQDCWAGAALASRTSGGRE